MILCCGEALIDMLPRATVAGEPAFAPHSGGAVFNTAIALGRLGVSVSFFTGLSTDFFGDQLRAELEASKVDLHHVRFSDRPTTLAFVKLNNGHASYAFFDENSAGRMLRESDLPVLEDEIQALHFSCISLIPEPCGSTYEALMRREHQRRVTMLDPNLRSAFVKDKEKHLQRMYRMIAMADIVKLSDEDIAWFGESGSHDEIAARWLEMGPKLVVITAGAKGADGYTKSAKIQVPAGKVAVVDTVGAGDTFNAGILASLHDGGLLTKQAVAILSTEQVEAALSLAAQAAAVTVSRAGANPPWRAELRRV
jgi:fructokinase